MNDIEEYLSSKGLEWRRSGKEALLRVCAYCQDEKGHFYVNRETGLNHCVKCDAGGGIYALKRAYGDIVAKEANFMFRPTLKAVKKPSNINLEAMTNNLMACKEAMDYLSNRGFDRSSVCRFKLGLMEKGHTRWLSIPHLRGCELINIKYRSLPPAAKVFNRIADCESILYNEDAVAPFNEIIICEGELDAMTLLAAGFENVIGLTCGAKTFKPEWFDLLESKSKIWICLDTDLEGKKGAIEIARRLGYDKCYQIDLGEAKDINEWFCAGGSAEKFKTMLECAAPFEIEHTRSVRTALDIFLKQDEFEKALLEDKIDTPWANVNAIIKNFNPGELIVLSAPPKTGKTMLALNIVSHNLKNDVSCFFYCLEMSTTAILKRFLIGWFHKRSWTKEELYGLAERLGEETPFLLGYNTGNLSPELAINTIRATVKRYGIRLVVLDHLHYLVRGDNMVEQTGQVVRQLKELAQELDIVLILIAQPRKIDLGKIMNFYDLKWSSDIPADADLLMFIQRQRIAPKDGKSEESFSRETLFRVDGAREVAGGQCKLYFNPDILQFEERETVVI